MSEEPDQLVEAAAAGDAEAIERLIQRHLPGLRAFVRLRADRIVRAKESSSDLVQSVCREVLEHMDRFTHRSDAGFRQWLYRTAERKVIDRFRYYSAARRDPDREVERDARAETQAEALLLEGYGTIYTPSRDAAIREELHLVEEAFGLLQGDYREIITMSRIVGLSNAEIAAELDRSEGSVRNALYRGLAQLSDLVARRRSD